MKTFTKRYEDVMKTFTKRYEDVRYPFERFISTRMIVHVLIYSLKNVKVLKVEINSRAAT
jgi:hypothetical protein